MVLDVVALWDRDVKAYGTPWFTRGSIEAMRQVQMLCAEPRSVIGRFPASYELRRLGMFDDTTGVFTLESVPEYLASVENLVEPASGGKE